jgi:hypothetical protein
MTKYHVKSGAVTLLTIPHTHGTKEPMYIHIRILYANTSHT